MVDCCCFPWWCTAQMCSIIGTADFEGLGSYQLTDLSVPWTSTSGTERQPVTATDRTVLSRLLSGLLCTLSSRAVFLSLLSQVSEREDRGKVGAWFFQVFSGLSLLALMQLVRELSFEKKQWLVVFDEQLLPVNSPLPLFSPLLTDAPFLFGTKPYQPPSPDEGFEF